MKCKCSQNAFYLYYSICSSHQPGNRDQAGVHRQIGNQKLRETQRLAQSLTVSRAEPQTQFIQAVNPALALLPLLPLLLSHTVPQTSCISLPLPLAH